MAIKMSKSAKYTILVLALIQVVLAIFIHIDLNTLAEKLKPEFVEYSFLGFEGKFNKATMEMILIIDAIIIAIALLLRRTLKSKGITKFQAMVEMFVDAFDGLVGSTVGESLKRIYLPLIATMFLFIFISNTLGIIPGLEEPTKDLNVPLGLAIVTVFVTHFSAIKRKGLIGYIKGYFEMPLLAPLDIVGEIAKGISICFRLFGNILGGSIIILVISNLTRFFLMPVGLNLFFGLFVGAIQAFVFSMLTITYIAVAISEE